MLITADSAPSFSSSVAATMAGTSQPHSSEDQLVDWVNGEEKVIISVSGNLLR
jgi:hypothetical protein